MEDRTEIGRFEANFMSFIHMIQKTPLYSEVVMYTVTMNYWTMPGITTPLLQSILALLINIASEHHMHPLETIEQVDAPTKIYLIDLADGSVLDGFVTEDPSMVFATHIMNAWEEGDEVVLDLATNPWDALKEFMVIETMLNHPETDSETADFVMKRVR